VGMMPRYYTAKQAAEILECDWRVIRDMVLHKEIAGAFKLRGRWKIPSKWVNLMIKPSQ
jgi:hypothetical protein